MLMTDFGDRAAIVVYIHYGDMFVEFISVCVTNKTNEIIILQEMRKGAAWRNKIISYTGDQR